MRQNDYLWSETLKKGVEEGPINYELNFTTLSIQPITTQCRNLTH